MHKLLRYYNQNKIKVWAVVLAIVLGYALLQVLNSAIANHNTEENNEQETTSNNVVSYRNLKQEKRNKSKFNFIFYFIYGVIYLIGAFICLSFIY